MHREAVVLSLKEASDCLSTEVILGIAHDHGAFIDVHLISPGSLSELRESALSTFNNWRKGLRLNWGQHERFEAIVCGDNVTGGVCRQRHVNASGCGILPVQLKVKL